MSNLAASRSGTRLAAVCVRVGVVVATTAAGAWAQDAVMSPMDGLTPAGMAPGSTAGSYALSGFDNVNLFSGNLSFSLPLHKIGGRGEAGYTLRLHIERDWTAKKEERGDAPGQYYVSMFPNPLGPGVNATPEIGLNAGFTLLRQLAILSSEPCSFPVNSDLQGTYERSISRVSVVGPDGSEHALSGGLFAQRCMANNGTYDTPTPTRRTFASTDGSRLWLHLDEPVDDIEAWGGYQARTILGWLSGRLVSGDGVTYRIDAGRVTWIQDRNGNVVEVTYPDGSTPDAAPSLIRDSLGRETTIQTNPGPGSGESEVVIRFDGAEGAERTIGIRRQRLSQALAPGESVKTHAELFGAAAPDMSEVERARVFDEPVVTAVVLPDGRQYSFTYTSYGKLKRVTLPTGGAIEYDYYGVEYVEVSGYTAHRIRARRVYDENTELVQEATYSYGDITGGSTTTVVTTDGSGVLSDVQHTFHGGRRDIPTPFALNSGFQGREYQTEQYQTEDRLLRTHTVTWSNRDLGPVVEREETRLEDGSTSRTTYTYDSFNNQTLATDYDYGGTTALRTRCTSFVAGGGYTDDPVHLVSLPQREAVYEGAGGGAGCPNSGALRALTTYGYDETGLTGRPGLSGYDQGFGEARRGNATTITRWGSHDGNVVTRREYDIAGNVVAMQDGRGKWTTIGYEDRWGIQGNAAGTSGSSTFAYPTEVTNPLGHMSYTRYDFGTGLVVQQQDANGVQAELRYEDDLDRLTSVVRAANVDTERARTRYAYDDANRRVTASSDQTLFGDGLLQSINAYDRLGRLVRTEQYEDSGVIVVDRHYDGLGRLVQVSNPRRLGDPEWTTTSYDRLSRPVAVSTPDGAATRTDYSGRTATVTDPADKLRTSRTDALGRVVAVAEGVSAIGSCGSANTTCYSYDALGNLTRVDQSGQIRSFSYDSLSQLRSASNPESGTVAYSSYDGNGNLLTRRDARGVVTNYSYDDLNRITSRAFSALSDPVSYEYDGSAGFGRGRLSRVSSTLSTRTIESYAASGRVVSQLQNTNGSDYRTTTKFNLAGQPVRQGYSSRRVVTTRYDSAGRVQGVTSVGPSGSAVDFVVPYFVSYAPHGGVTRMVLGNGLVEEGWFNNRLQRLHTEVIDASAEPNVTRLRLVYGYGDHTNNNGNVLSQQIEGLGSVGVQTYVYNDPRNRLTHVEESAPGKPSWGQTFAYDSYGNRRVVAGVIPMSSVALTPTAEGDIDAATNRITMGSEYDAAGNQWRDAVDRTFEYDAENRMVAFSAAGRFVEYGYDGDGRRVIKQETAGATSVYVYDAEGRLLEEHSDADAVRPVTDYIYAGSQLVGEARSWTAGEPPPPGVELRISPLDGASFNQVMPFEWRRVDGVATYHILLQTPQGGGIVDLAVSAAEACPPAEDHCHRTTAEMGRRLRGVKHQWKLRPEGKPESATWWTFDVEWFMKGAEYCYRPEASCETVCSGLPAPCDAPCRRDDIAQRPYATCGSSQDAYGACIPTDEYSCAVTCEPSFNGSTCLDECTGGLLSKGRTADCGFRECCYDPSIQPKCKDFVGINEYFCSTTASCPAGFDSKHPTSDCAMCCVSHFGLSCAARGGDCRQEYECQERERNLGQTATCKACCVPAPPPGDSCEWDKGGECWSSACVTGYTDIGTTSDCKNGKRCCREIMPNPQLCNRGGLCDDVCKIEAGALPPCDAPCEIRSPVYQKLTCNSFGFCSYNAKCGSSCYGVGECAETVDAPCPSGTSSVGRTADCLFARCCK